MSVALVEKNRDFIDYSMFDVDGRKFHTDLLTSQTSLKNALISKNPHYTYKQIPQQNGFFSLKYLVYINTKFHLQTDYFSIMFAKESILNTRSNNYNLNIELFP
jgi:hypothetical protein